MGYFILSLLAFSIGFFVGLKVKAQLKESKKEKIKEFTIANGVKMSMERAKEEFDAENLPGHRNAPPPPPIRVIKEGEKPREKQIEHIKPDMYYDKGTFVKTNKCSNCKAIGMHSDMWSHNPCPKCGGNVRTNGAAKWNDGKWEESKA